MALNVIDQPSRTTRLAIHAPSHRLVARMLAVMLAAFFVGQLVVGIARITAGAGFGTLGWLPVLCILVALVIRAMLRGTPPVFATSDGLQFGTGSSARCIPWQHIRGVRQLPRYNLTTSSWSRLYEVALVNGEELRFVGRTNALDRIAQARRADTKSVPAPVAAL